MAFDDSSLPPVRPDDAASLVAMVAGSVLLPGDAAYDDERAVWNRNHEPMPAVIVVPASAADVQAAIRFAAGPQCDAGRLSPHWPTGQRAGHEQAGATSTLIPRLGIGLHAHLA